MTWLIACEESGTVRDAMLARGIDAVSCDLLPTRSPGPHIQGDLFDHIGKPWSGIVAFWDCTYLTCSAEWAYADPDFVRWPGVGYHQRVKPQTLTGEARRQARIRSIEAVRRIWAAHDRVILENPVGVLSSVIGRPQVVQPFMFGDDASKATCIWTKGVRPIVIPDEDFWYPPRIVGGRKRWSNQTDSGQNRLSPSPNRARDRSVTFPGIARAIVECVL